MQRYREDAGSPTRIDYGFGLVVGLQAFQETSNLAPTFEQVNNDLADAYDERIERRKPLVKARFGLRFANHQIDQTTRMIHGAAQIADGGRKGPITEALFPEGLTPEIRPKGAAQIKPSEELLGRFAKSKLAAVADLGATWVPRLAADLAALRSAAETHKNANDAYVDAFKTELAERAEHARQVDRVMGLVRAAFPRDKARQDLVFPEVERGSGGGDDDLDEAPPVDAAAPAVS